jgi:hypothetical protein
MPITILLMAAQAAPDLVATATARTTVESRCIYDPHGTDVTVCGRRNADRFRVPFVVHDPGDPRHEGVAAERARLLHRTNPVDDLTPFLVGNGMAGVTMTVGGDGVATGGYRPLAP